MCDKLHITKKGADLPQGEPAIDVLAKYGLMDVSVKYGLTEESVRNWEQLWKIIQEASDFYTGSIDIEYFLDKATKNFTLEKKS